MSLLGACVEAPDGGVRHVRGLLCLDQCPLNNQDHREVRVKAGGPRCSRNASDDLGVLGFPRLAAVRGPSVKRNTRSQGNLIWLIGYKFEVSQVEFISTMPPGAKKLTSRDWIFGSRPRRLVLQFVLANQPGPEGWTKTALAKQAEVHPKGGIDEHVRGLVALDLLRECNGRYWPVKPRPGLASRLKGLMRELEQVPENRIEDEARVRNAITSP